VADVTYSLRDLIALAAGVTWLVVKYSPLKTT